MKIQILDNGPILITDENMKPIALCRCGLTQNKPYCDGSHRGKFEGAAALILELNENDCGRCNCGGCCDDKNTNNLE